MRENLTSHAYLLLGDPVSAEKELCIERGSPDFFPFREALFGIEEARALVEMANRRSFTGKKIFFITPERITLEAQNALLKTFEEPTLDTQFFLCVSDESVILPTLKSRMQVVNVQHRVLNKRAEKFFNLPVAKRLEFAKKFADDEENLTTFLDELLLLKRAKEIYRMRLLSNDRAASPRLILEHLSLLV